MSAKSILEADGKAIINYHLTRAPVIKPTPLPASSTHNPPSKLASLHFAADADVKGVLDQAEATYPWLLASGAKFVAKPDQLIKRRGKSGLLALNKTWPEARAWIQERAGKPQRVETVDGVLRQFLVEPFVPHPQNTEYYININSVREVRAVPFLCGRVAERRNVKMGELGKMGKMSRELDLQQQSGAVQAGGFVLLNGRSGEGKSYPGPLCEHTPFRSAAQSPRFEHVTVPMQPAPAASVASFHPQPCGSTLALGYGATLPITSRPQR